MDTRHSDAIHCPFGGPAMPKSYQMTWVPETRRWTKFHRGKRYFVSCRQLGVPETKDASWRAANEWWGRQKDILEQPVEDTRTARAMQVDRLVKDFSKLDDDARREAVEALLGAGSFDALKSQAGNMLASIEPSSPERAVAAQIDAWKTLLKGVTQSGQMSEGRYDAYVRNIGTFTAWIGPEAAIDSIDEGRLEAYFNHLTQKVSAGDYSPNYAHTLLMTAKQFIARLAELKLIALPGNIRSRRFRFNASAAKKIETFNPEEIRELLAASTERTRLFILLMLNCGQYQNDIAELRQDEIDWQMGTITRARSKTRERGGPVVTYKLWPETFELLKRLRNTQLYDDSVKLALTTERGNPLVEYRIDAAGKFSRYDAIQSAWNRLAAGLGKQKHRLGMKHLRKTGATLLGQHPHYKFYVNHYLADSPAGIAAKHYVVPSDAEFFEALEWLRGQLIPQGVQPPA